MSDCAACRQRPVQDATVCTNCADDLSRALGDVTAIIDRPPRHKPSMSTPRPPETARDEHRSLPSSIFDLPSGPSLRLSTRNLGTELDVTRAHQATMTRREASKVVATSRVFTPRAHLDRVQGSLDAALTMWANVVETEHQKLPPTPVRPRRDGTGRHLGALAGWLLNYVEWLRHHPEGAAAVEQITRAVADVERVVDAPPEKFYLGPCRRPDETAPTGKCLADLYAYAEARPGKPPPEVVLCPACLHPHKIDERRQWLRDHMRDVVATATEVSRAAGILDLAVTPERIWKWKERGRIITHGTRQVGRKAMPLYRIGDILDLATEADTRKRTA